MASGAAGNFLYAMQVGTGVFGGATVVEIPQPGGGYRRRAQLNLSVTRAQTQFNFEAKTKIVRLATGQMPAVTYVIDQIDVNDPLCWTLVLVRAGA
jgi:hypothetical protein